MAHTPIEDRKHEKIAWLRSRGRMGDGLQIFSCEPEWAALARDVGGEKVNAFSATHARQDPHHIRARPNLIAKIRRADLVFCSGADLEVGWLPLLMRRGARSGVQPGAT